MLKLASLAAMIAFTGQSALAMNQLDYERPHVQGELLITFDEDLSESQKEQLIAESGGSVIHEYKYSNSVLVKLPETNGFVSSANFLAEDSAVENISLNHIFSINVTPNDPNESKQYQNELIGADKAWGITTGSKDIVVAVIDTGVDYNHPDLKDNYWSNPGETGKDSRGNDKRTNGIDDDNNGYIDDHRGWDFANNDNDPMDDNAHGTHCAGSIGAVGDNGIGIAGLNWNVSIVGLKFIGRGGTGTLGDAAKAVEYAVTMGFDVTSNSWGGAAEKDTATAKDPLFAAIKAANKKGQLFIAAAGNNGSNNDNKKLYPANYDVDNIISVAASDSRDRLASFSNYGPKTIDLMAPGSGIYSTSTRSLFGQIYRSMSGTSMAAPIVAGAVALVKSANPDLSAKALKQRIISTVDPVSSVRSKLKSGGRLNVYKALNQ
ncbi:MAG: subtilase [Zetaproteobacteria bacterium]|nr:subtilase [Pseudobdellovibrionaceae bacterium]